MKYYDSLRTLLYLLVLVSIIAAFTNSASAQPSSVDPSFNAVPSLNITDPVDKGVVVAPGGKLVIWGGQYAIEGSAKGDIARLNGDGSLDETFDYCGCSLARILSVYVLKDGKILAAGEDATGRAKIIRLSTDGSVDIAFNGTFPASLGSTAEIVAVRSDGKILASVLSSTIGFHTGEIRRFKSDGSIDDDFAPIVFDSGRTTLGVLRAVVLDSSNRIYISVTTLSGSMSTASIRRHNPDGTEDPTWISPSVETSNFPTEADVLGLDIQSDGKLIAAGRFDTVNGVEKPGIVRFLSEGSVDIDFASTIGPTGGRIESLPDGKILVGVGSVLIRLNSDGRIENSFSFDPTYAVFGKWVVDLTGRILYLGRTAGDTFRFVRLNSNGSVDSDFSPNVTVFGQVHALARQPDGKILLAGRFTQYNGEERWSLVRVDTDGTLDPTFDAGTGFDVPPRVLIVEPDETIVAAGAFSTYNGTARQGIVRLNSNGDIVSDFAPLLPPSSQVDAIAIQSDGKIIIVGTLDSVDGNPRTAIARLESNGTLDQSFDPIFESTHLYDVLVQADGKIVVGGAFSSVNGTNRSGMVRLEADGSVDESFNAGNLGLVERIRQQTDGRFLYSRATTIARRNVDGTLDTRFFSPAIDRGGSAARSIDAFIIQPDGSMIVGGRFDIVNGAARRNLMRLSASGVIDVSFFPEGTDGEVRSIITQPDGKIIIGGDFTRVDNVRRAGNARLNISSFQRRSPFDFDGDGRADFSVYRPGTRTWFQFFSNGGSIATPVFGIAGDIPAPADYDGDGKTDLAVFRPSTGDWWVRSSRTNADSGLHWGAAGDIPLPSDIDGDGKADFVVFRPSQNTWYRFGTGGSISQIVFGVAGDKPLIGDFDGDGRYDAAVFRPSTGDWWYASSELGGAFRAIHWGQNGDIPVAADFDGDGKTDFAVFRPGNGGWYILSSSNGWVETTVFGLNGDRPVAADYDGDGRADIALFRPSTGVWYVRQSTAGFTAFRWGVSGDVAIPNVFTPQ